MREVEGGKREGERGSDGRRGREIRGQEKVLSANLPTPSIFGSMLSKCREAPENLDKPDHRAHLTTPDPERRGPEQVLLDLWNFRNWSISPYPPTKIISKVSKLWRKMAWSDRTRSKKHNELKSHKPLSLGLVQSGPHHPSSIKL